MKYRFIIFSIFCSLFISFPSIASIIEIERSFMEHDYPRAEVLAQETLRRPGNDEQLLQYYLGLSQIRLTKYGLAASDLKDLVNDPSVSPDFTQEKFFKHLNLLKKNGKFVFPNPNIMIKMGGKDSLVKIKNSIFGKKDTYAYYNLYDWNTTFIEDLKKNPFEKRVIKQNNGSFCRKN